MFESSFRKIAKFSSKHSTAVIVFWIALVVAAGPFSTLLFSNTSYDLGGSIVPANSMAQEASDLQSTYFSNSTGPGSNGSSLLVVTQNTTVDSQGGTSGLLSLQENMTAYLKTVPGYENLTSIFTLENSTLANFSNGIKQELNGTYPLISSLNSQIQLLNQSINQTLGLIYGLPAIYLSYYNGTPGSNVTAYQRTYQAALALGNPSAQAYVNSFTHYWNLTNQSLLYSISEMNSSIYETLFGASNFALLLSQNQTQQNFTYSLFYGYAFSSYLQMKYYNEFVKNYTVAAIAPQLSTNSSLVSFINDSLALNVTNFLDKVYTLGQPATAAQIVNFMIPMVTRGLEASLNGSPVISYNSKSLPGYLTALNDTKNISHLVNSELLSGSFSTYPIIPTPYVFHQFVGYDNKTTIIIATFSNNYSLSVVNTISNLAKNNYSKTGQQLPGSNYYVAGTGALSQQLNNEILGGMVRALAIGIVLSVIIVGLFFRSPVAAFIPLSIFGMSTAISMGLNGLLYKYILHAQVSFITPTLLLILILGLTSDYVVYIMSRYRQEKRKKNKEASLETGQWAGHAVFTSGITVALSYIVLWVSNIPIFSDSGLTNAIGVGVSIALANTFLIAILHKSGTKLYWPSNITHAEKFPLEKSMTSISHIVSGNKKKIFVAFLVLTFVASYVYLITPTGMDVYDLVPSSSGIQALQVVNSSFNGDFFDRGYIIMHFSSPVLESNGSYNLAEVAQINSVESALLNQSEITQVYGPTYPYGTFVPINLTGIPAAYHSTYTNQTDTFIGNDTHYVTVDFQLSSVAWKEPASNFVSSIPGIVNNALNSSSASGQTATPSYYIGGLTQSLNDAYSYTSTTFLKIVPILLLAIFVVLLIQLSSVFTPIRLIAMVVSSVTVALAAVFAIIYYASHEPLLIFLPLFTFITLLAVGLDYDIFMVARVRESVLGGMDDEEAVRTSIKENGGVIITLGMLLFVTFGALYLSGIGIMEEIGLGLALGVIVDTFLSWPFFVPTIMMFLKKWNWWPSKMKAPKQ